MNFDIDTSGSGSYADDLSEGATRFCEAHPEEKWQISGVLVQIGLSLNASDGKHSLTMKILPPVMDMEDSVFEALEAFREAN